MATLSKLMGTAKKSRSTVLTAALSLVLPILSLVCILLLEKGAALSLRTVILSGLSALSAFVYFKRRHVSDMAALMASLAYALSAFLLLASEIALTLSLSFVLFPAVILGAELVAEGKTVFPFAVSLSLILLLADNLSFVALVAALLWFILRLIEVEADEAMGFYRSVRFILAAVAAFFIAAIRLLPRLLALDTSLLFAEGETAAPLWLIPSKLLPSVYDSVIQAASPFLYIGLLPLLLIPAYFGSKGETKRSKITSSVFLGVLFVFGTMPFFSEIFTVLGDTVSFRYGGTLPLVLFSLLLAAKGLDRLKEERATVYTAAAGVILTALVLYQQFNQIFTKETDEYYLVFPLFETLWLSVGAVFLYLSLIPLLSRVSAKRVKTAVLSALTLVLLTEMSLSASSTLKTASGELASIHRVSSPTYTVTYANAPKRSEEYEELFFRKYEVKSQKLVTVSAVGDVSPSDKEALDKLLRSFGIEKNGSAYLGANPVFAILSGTLYTDKQIPYHKSPVKISDEQLYKTSIYLSIGSAVSEGILRYTPDESSNPFTELSRFVSSLTGESSSLFTFVEEKGGVFRSKTDCLLVSVDGKVTTYYGNAATGTSVNASSLSGTQILAAEINDAALRKALQHLYGHRFDTTVATLGEIAGNLYAQKGKTVFCTNLPYSDTYTVTVDEEAAEAINMNGLLAVRISDGDYHYISIRYEPIFTKESELYPVTVTLAAIFAVLLLTWAVFSVIDKRKPLMRKHPIGHAMLFPREKTR